MGLGEPLASARLVVPKEPAHAQRRVVSAQRGHISHSGTGVRTPCGALLASEAIARRWGGCGARFWQDAEFVLEACTAYAPVLGVGGQLVALQHDHPLEPVDQRARGAETRHAPAQDHGRRA